MIRRLLLLNGLATLGVVLYHASSWGFVAMFWWTDRYLPVEVPNFDQLGSLSYYGLRTVEQVIIFSIPAFLFVSGFFVAVACGRNRRTVEWKLVRARISHLVIPYLVWSLLIFVGDFAQGTTYSGPDYVRRLALGQARPGFYYVPLLTQLYLLSPLLIPVARTRWKWLLVAAALVQLAAQGLRYPATVGVELPALKPFLALTPAWLFPGRIFWFVLGLVAGFHLQHLKRWLARVKWGLLVGSIVLVPVGMLEFEILLRFSGENWIAPAETVIDSLYAGCLILAFLAFDKTTIPLSKSIDQIGGKSFGVYLVHGPVLEVASRVAYHVVPGILAFQALFQPLLVVLGLGIPLLVMMLVDRSPAHRVYHYLFG